MRVFGWDYPPGVTGNEPQIAGYAGVMFECRECQARFEDAGTCPDCSEPLVEVDPWDDLNDAEERRQGLT